MGFPTAISSGQKTTLRTSGYWQRTFMALNPGAVVFQAEANQDITDAPFKAFAWTNTLDGAYTDVWQGMVCYISATTDYAKDYKYRGRVRLTPSSSEFRIDLNATTLETGDIITVIRDVDLFARIRETDSVDGSVSYHNLPPMTTGLPSVVVLYDSDNDGTVEWTPAQTGIATASGATISAYAWAVSGTGGSTVSSASAQNPDFTFDAGEHYLVRLTTTDSNGVTNFIIVQVYAVTRTFTAPVIKYVVAGSVQQDLDNGYSGSVTAYAGVEDLPYRTHSVVFSVEHFGDNSDTPIVTNVLMHGRLRSEQIRTEGSNEAGTLMEVTYPIEGITAYLQRLKVPNDIVRYAASPDEWGEMVNPTPYRMAVYFLFAYTTLLNIASFSAGDSLFVAWQRGGFPVSIDGGYALDALNTILSSIDAGANFAPDGEIRCEISAAYKVDRSGLSVIMDFLVQDTQSFEINKDTSKQTAQVIGYGGSWNSTNNTFILYTAQSPSVVYVDAPETREYNRGLLKHDQTTGAAATELGSRTGNDYAFHNAKLTLSAVLRDAHRWMVATNYQRYSWTIAATDNLRALAVTTATYWQCQSLSITINGDGTYDVGAEFIEETEFTDAQNIASLLPENLPQQQPILPFLSDYPAFPDNPFWAYPTDTPSDAELQPDPYSGFLSKSPFTPDEAAKAGRKQGTAKCKTAQVNMRNPGTTLGNFLTVNTAGYTVKITGSGKISENIAAVPAAAENSGNGYDTLLDVTAGDMVSITCDSGDTWEGGTMIAYNADGASGIFDAQAYAPADELYCMIYRIGTSGAWTKAGLSVSFTAAASGRLYLLCNDVPSAISPGSYADNVGTITASVTGLTSSPAEYGDAFYRFNPTSGESDLFDPTAGLLIAGNKPAVIPAYSPSHLYLVQITGDGNQPQLNYALTDYTNTANQLLTLEYCRNP